MLFYELVLCEKHAKQGKPYNANIFGAVQNEELVMHSSRPSFPKNKREKKYYKYKSLEVYNFVVRNSHIYLL